MKIDTLGSAPALVCRRRTHNLLEICPHCAAQVLFIGDKCPACGKASARPEPVGFAPRESVGSSSAENVSQDSMSPAASDADSAGAPVSDGAAGNGSENATIIEVRFSESQVRQYATAAELRQDILKGRVNRETAARVRPANAQGSGETAAEPEWRPLSTLAQAIPELDAVYRPVWSHAKKGFYYGALTVIALKAIDTTITLFSIEPIVGVFWLITIGSLFFRNFMVPVLVSFLALKVGLKINLFITVMGVGITGLLLGGPLGMALGTLVGGWRRAELPTAPDALAEGSKPYVCGLLLPGAAFVALAWLYFAWFNPAAAEWLSSH